MEIIRRTLIDNYRRGISRSRTRGDGAKRTIADAIFVMGGAGVGSTRLWLNSDNLNGAAERTRSTHGFRNDARHYNACRPQAVVLPRGAKNVP